MSGPFKMKGSSSLGHGNQHGKSTAFKMHDSPAKHAPYAAAHTKAEGKISHPASAEAHGKKTEDYYDGSNGKEISTTGAKRDSLSKSYTKKPTVEE